MGGSVCFTDRINISKHWRSTRVHQKRSQDHKIPVVMRPNGLMQRLALARMLFKDSARKQNPTRSNSRRGTTQLYVTALALKALSILASPWSEHEDSPSWDNVVATIRAWAELYCT